MTRNNTRLGLFLGPLTVGGSRKLSVLVLTSSVLLSLTTVAMAQSDTVRALYISAANVPTNITSIHTYAEAPKGFNPVAASDEELATYGFPLRPDKQADPKHYALWERAMVAAKIRWNGELKTLGGPAGPALRRRSPAIPASWCTPGSPAPSGSARAAPGQTAPTAGSPGLRRGSARPRGTGSRRGRRAAPG